MKPIRRATLLCADDDADDRLLVKDAVAESTLESELRFVTDGEDLMDYLLHRGAYVEPGSAPRPHLLLLDLNMPRMDGREAIVRIRANIELRTLPVVVMSTSDAREDIEKAYALGANSYVVKPASFESLVGLISELGKYWLETVELPPAPLQ